MLLSIPMYKHQAEAVYKMHNGCILVGGVGSGKSRTALAYYILDSLQIGNINKADDSSYECHLDTDDIPEATLYIITTARNSLFIFISFPPKADLKKNIFFQNGIRVLNSIEN